MPIAISAAPKMYRSFVPMPPVSGSPLMDDGSIIEV